MHKDYSALFLVFLSKFKVLANRRPKLSVVKKLLCHKTDESRLKRCNCCVPLLCKHFTKNYPVDNTTKSVEPITIHILTWGKSKFFIVHIDMLLFLNIYQ